MSRANTFHFKGKNTREDDRTVSLINVIGYDLHAEHRRDNLLSASCKDGVITVYARTIHQHGCPVLTVTDILTRIKNAILEQDPTLADEIEERIKQLKTAPRVQLVQMALF